MRGQLGLKNNNQIMPTSQKFSLPHTNQNLLQKLTRSDVFSFHRDIFATAKHF
jgi:hypothetical protein